MYGQYSYKSTNDDRRSVEWDTATMNYWLESI
jgi:hypothetical protein